MKKFMLIENDKQEVEFEYEVGEILVYNSNGQIKCVKKEVVGDELLQYFVVGIKTFTFEEYKE